MTLKSRRFEAGFPTLRTMRLLPQIKKLRKEEFIDFFLMLIHVLYINKYLSLNLTLKFLPLPQINRYKTLDQQGTLRLGSDRKFL
jgi:hypothetical protein